MVVIRGYMFLGSYLKHLKAVIARYEAILDRQRGYANLPRKSGIASYLAMTLVDIAVVFNRF